MDPQFRRPTGPRAKLVKLVKLIKLVKLAYSPAGVPPPPSEVDVVPQNLDKLVPKNRHWRRVLHRCVGTR